MNFKQVKVKDLMGCNYEIDFDPRYTVIIGDNRQGKTLTARLIMLALYGLDTPAEVHNSWKLKKQELLPTSDSGVVEVILETKDRVYKVRREFTPKRNKVRFYNKQGEKWKKLSWKDTEVKEHLEEINITPGLMNIAMSNEQSLIGAICYDNELQADVWRGWEWKTEIIRGNFKRARNTCSREATNLEGELKKLEGELESIQENWIKNGIFTEGEVNAGLSEEVISAKVQEITKKEEDLKEKIKHYSEFHDTLIRQEDLEHPDVIKNLLNSLHEKRKVLEEKAEIEDLESQCKEYSSILDEVMKKGGKDELSDHISRLDDELKKLQAAKGIKDRKEKPISSTCDVYPPEPGENLIVEITSDIAAQFKYEEIAGGGVAVPYDDQKEKNLEKRKQDLENLLKNFDDKKGKVKKVRDTVRDDIVGDKKQKLGKKGKHLENQGHLSLRGVASLK